jgi:hypothetical protein
MTTGPGRTIGEVCAAAEEALAEAAFRTGEFSDAERLFGEALSMAELDADRQTEARALGGLGMVRHHGCIARLVAGLAPDDADVAAEEELLRGALAIWLETGDAVGTARALFGMGLVHQVLHRDWAAVVLLAGVRAGSRAAWSRWARPSSPPGSRGAPSNCTAARPGWPGRRVCCRGGSRTPSGA